VWLLDRYSNAVCPCVLRWPSCFLVIRCIMMNPLAFHGPFAPLRSLKSSSEHLDPDPLLFKDHLFKSKKSPGRSVRGQRPFSIGFVQQVLSLTPAFRVLDVPFLSESPSYGRWPVVELRTTGAPGFFRKMLPRVSRITTTIPYPTPV